MTEYINAVVTHDQVSHSPSYGSVMQPLVISSRRGAPGQLHRRVTQAVFTNDNPQLLAPRRRYRAGHGMGPARAG